MGYVEVFSDANFQGRVQRFEVGRHDIGVLTVGNDSISSIRVCGDVEVVIYSDAGFQGQSMVVRSDMTGLGSWNDQISSLEVRAVASSGAPVGNVVVYSDANFMGRSQTLAPGRYDLNALTVGNDSISSIRVPAGMTLTAYWDGGFQGQSRVFTADTANLADWNDRISSLEVKAGRVITVYSDVNFLGRSQSFAPGNFDVSALSVVGDRGIKSIRVPAGMYVSVFTDTFKGWARLVQSDTSDLTGFAYAQGIHSLRVVDGPSVLSLYGDINFQGNSQVLGPGNYLTGNLTIGNDSISSVRVPNGMAVEIFEDDNFMGRHLTLNNDSPDLRNRTFTVQTSGGFGSNTGSVGSYQLNWNDRISSLKVWIADQIWIDA